MTVCFPLLLQYLLFIAAVWRKESTRCSQVRRNKSEPWGNSSFLLNNSRTRTKTELPKKCIHLGNTVENHHYRLTLHFYHDKQCSVVVQQPHSQSLPDSASISSDTWGGIQRKIILLGQFREDGKLGSGGLSKITNRKRFLNERSKPGVQLATEPRPHLPNLPPKRPRFFFSPLHKQVCWK